MTKDEKVMYEILEAIKQNEFTLGVVVAEIEELKNKIHELRNSKTLIESELVKLRSDLNEMIL